jgi:hypothetical protein
LMIVRRSTLARSAACAADIHFVFILKSARDHPVPFHMKSMVP